MPFYTAWFRRRAIIQYKNRLPSALARDYGKCASYFPEQVMSTIHRTRLSEKHSIFALSMFCTPVFFSSYCKLHAIPQDYMQCQQIVLDIITTGDDEIDSSDMNIIGRISGDVGDSPVSSSNDDFGGGGGGD